MAALAKLYRQVLREACLFCLRPKKSGKRSRLHNACGIEDKQGMKTTPEHSEWRNRTVKNQIAPQKPAVLLAIDRT